MIRLGPWNDLDGYAVLARLDAADLLEAQATRGGDVTGLSLFAEWRGAQAGAHLSLIAHTVPGAQAFAVLGLFQSGIAGVAVAGFLARHHARFAWPLARLGAAIRAELPATMRAHGLNRIEVRAWAGHPRAGRLLRHIGFHQECSCPGCGPQGDQTFLQFAYVIQPQPAERT